MKPKILFLLAIAASLSSATPTETKTSSAPSTVISRSISMPVTLSYDLEKIRWSVRRADALIVSQDPAPGGDPGMMPIIDATLSINGRAYQVNRIALNAKDYGAFRAALYTGGGWALDNGAAVVSPFGLGAGFDLDLDLFKINVGVGTDLIMETGQKSNLIFYFRAALVAIPTG